MENQQYSGNIDITFFLKHSKNQGIGSFKIQPEQNK